MSDNRQYIASLCKQISQQGRTPSVALIKKMSARPLALPEIISTLKCYKVDPQQVTNQVDAPVRGETKAPAVDDKLADLTQRVQQLEAQMAKLLGK